MQSWELIFRPTEGFQLPKILSRLRSSANSITTVRSEESSNNSCSEITQTFDVFAILCFFLSCHYQGHDHFGKGISDETQIVNNKRLIKTH